MVLTFCVLFHLLVITLDFIRQEECLIKRVTNIMWVEQDKKNKIRKWQPWKQQEFNMLFKDVDFVGL